MRYSKIIMLLVMGSLIIVACDQAQEPQAPSALGELVSNGIVPTDRESDIELTSALQPVQERIVLKNASLTLTIEDAVDTINQFGRMAEEMGGWVVSSNTSKISRATGEVTQGTITIRVPATKFDDALLQMKAGVLSIESESVTGQDVTQEYTDLTSQLSNLRAAEAQLQKIMESTNTTEDVLRVYNELVRVRGEIETTQGRIRFYEESSAFSSISAILMPEAVEAPIQIAGWSPGRTAESALAALVNVLRFAADVIITLLILLLPLLILFGIPAWFIYRTLKRRGIIPLRTEPETNVSPEQP